MEDGELNLKTSPRPFFPLGDGVLAPSPNCFSNKYRKNAEFIEKYFFSSPVFAVTYLKFTAVVFIKSWNNMSFPGGDGPRVKIADGIFFG